MSSSDTKRRECKKSNNEEINKSLQRKRVGILKNPSILKENNQDDDDLFTEHLYLINLNKKEPITRKKTLNMFKKSFFEDDYNPERKIQNILKKQASLKEILISSKKMRILLEQNKIKREPCVISEFWSDKYYRSLFHHSKLDSLIKETEKDKIWRYAKQKAIFNQLKEEPLKTKNFKSFMETTVFQTPSFQENISTHIKKLPILQENDKKISNSLNVQMKKLKEQANKNEKMSKSPLKHKRYKSVDKVKFYKAANSSLSTIINDCDENKKDSQIMKEIIHKGIEERQEKKRNNDNLEKMEQTKQILGTYFLKKYKNKSLYL